METQTTKSITETSAASQLKKDIAYSIESFNKRQKEFFIMQEFIDVLPDEIKNLSDCHYINFYNWNETLCLHYSNPDHWKPLKIAGVMGLKRTFNGKYTDRKDDWRWEGGEMIVEKNGKVYKYNFDISTAHVPNSCQIIEEEVTETVTHTKLRAICPESMEEV